MDSVEPSFVELFLSWRSWLIVVTLTLLTLISSVAKYRIGRRGLPIVKKHFPQVSEERWDRLGNGFQRWGATVVFFSFMPVLGWVIPPAAGAFGVRFGPFLVFAFLAKLFRYWLLLIIAFGGFQFIFS